MPYPVISIVDIVYWGGFLLLVIGINLSYIVKGTGVLAFFIVFFVCCALVGYALYYTPQVLHGTAPEWVFKLLQKG